MKKILLALVAIAIVCGANAQLSQIVVESTTDGTGTCAEGIQAPPPGTTTYRVYAELEDPEDFVSAMFAISGCYPMEFSTTTTFYNQAQFGVTIGANLIPTLCAAFPEIGYDSWLTLGAEDNSVEGATVSAAWSDPEDPMTPAFGTPDGTSFLAIDGVFFTTSGNVAGTPTGPNNRVLLGQFTTDGDFSYKINLNVFDDGSNTVGNYQYMAYEDLDCSSLQGTMFDGRALGLVYPYVGCDDDSACNYNPNAEVIDNNICCFGTCGCSDEAATNYDPDATCGISDNCEYGISGSIYEDVNLNSQYDDGEPFLEGIVVEIESTGETATTNENGEYVFPSLDPGFYNLVVQTTETYMFRSHSSPFSVNSVVEVEHQLGISSEIPSCCYHVPNGYVFEDANEDGIQQIDETAISGVELIAQPGDVSVTSDENGWFEFPPLEIEQGLAIYVQAPVSHPFTTSGFPYVLSQNNAQDIEVGLSADLPQLTFCVTCLFEEMLLCSSGSEGTCYIENNSNVPISGVLDIHPSDIYSDFDPFAFDSIVDGHYFMSFDEILPGETGLVDGDSYSYTTPPVQYIGDPLFLNHEVTVYHNDEYFGQGNYDFNSFVTCAYDPNDIQVEPRGYDEEHYVLPETDLVYRIRFQNTGNAPAQNILVQDTIPEELDLSSLQLLEYSHDIELTVDQNTRVANFFFPLIQLPDSNCCEPDSHGELTFRIEMNEDLAPETRIENTAYIYFDNNPAVVTNTTWTTIYECTQDLADFSIAQAEICADETIEAQAGEELIEGYTWVINDETQGELSALNLEELEPGMYDLQLTVNNPLCEAESMQAFEVYELPNASFNGGFDNLLIADDLSLSTYQWYLNGMPIDGATSSEFNFVETGAYSLEVTNDEGCSTLSEELIMTFLAIDELNKHVLSMYPNPVDDQLFIEFSGTAQRQIQIYSIDGRLVKELNCNSNKCSVDVSDLASGKYELMIVGEGMSKATFIKQ